MNVCTRFQTLEEDCLLEIFSFLSLDIMDLCAVAETCKRFRSIAQRVIRKNFSFHVSLRASRVSRPLKTHYAFKWGKWKYNSDEQINVERIFRNFGSCLSEVLVIIYERKAEFVLNLVNEHCRDELKTLSINRISDVAEPVELKPVFERMQNLHIERVFIVEAATLFRKFDSLVELNVTSVTNCSTILESVFPHLENFAYWKYKVVKGNETSQEENQQSLGRILTFIKRHSSLKKLAVGFYSDQKCWTAIIQTIGSNCTKLQELQVKIHNKLCQFSSVPLKSLQALTSLKTIRLENTFFRDFEIFGSFKDLRELDLVDCYLPKNLNQFAHLAQINCFRLEMHWNRGSVMEKVDIVGIIRWLINLEKFVIRSSLDEFVLNETKFSEIADLVRQRSNVLTMKCNSTVTKSARNLIVTKHR